MKWYYQLVWSDTITVCAYTTLVVWDGMVSGHDEMVLPVCMQ